MALAAIAWWWTAGHTSGMDQGPGTALGAVGWFIGIWVVMMAAMMLPSAWPTVALYSEIAGQQARIRPLLFVAGYLVTWTAAGLFAYGVFDLGHGLLDHWLAWDRAGRWVAGGTLAVAALYQLTPLKEICLAKCRSPLGFLLSSWRDGAWGAAQMGARHGAWCTGCCWALMASLFALGVMSLTWMAFVAALIAFEKTVPRGRPVTYTTAAVVLALGVLLVVTPDALPGLTVPGHSSAMGVMSGHPAPHGS